MYHYWGGDGNVMSLCTIIEGEMISHVLVCHYLGGDDNIMSLCNCIEGVEDMIMSCPCVSLLGRR